MTLQEQLDSLHVERDIIFEKIAQVRKLMSQELLINLQISEIKAMGYERIAQEIEKQITLTLSAGGSLDNIVLLAEDEHQKCKDLNLLINVIV